MTLLKQTAPISAWLQSCGLGKVTAVKAAEALVGPMAQGRPLSQDQSALMTAYLGRAGASHAADADLTAAVKRQNMFPHPHGPTPKPVPPGPIPIPYPILNPPPKKTAGAGRGEWTDLNSNDPGIAGGRAPKMGGPALSLGDQSATRGGLVGHDTHTIQALANRVAR